MEFLDLIHMLHWLLIVSVLGVMEATIFHQVNFKPGFRLKGWLDEHFWFVVVRVLIAMAVFNTCNLLYLLAAALVLPLFHDGFYYLTRHLLDNRFYPDGFSNDKSKTSDAIFSFSFPGRVILFILGIGVYIVALKVF
jgi:hypothetical protein